MNRIIKDKILGSLDMTTLNKKDIGIKNFGFTYLEIWANVHYLMEVIPFRESKIPQELLFRTWKIESHNLHLTSRIFI